MVNLLSNDVNRLEYVIFFLNSIWISPLLTIIVAYLMWHKVGVAGLIGIMIIFIVAPILGKIFVLLALQPVVKYLV